MQDQSITAVTLRAVDYGENDKILTLFVPESGLITARLRGVKKARSRLKYAAEPFCYGVFELVKLRSGGFIVTGCRTLEQFYELRSSVTALYAGSLMLKFCLLFAVSDNSDYTPLFKHLITSLTLLKYGGSEPEVVAYFLLNALSVCGYDLSRRLTLSNGSNDGDNIDIENPEVIRGRGDAYIKKGAVSCLHRLSLAAPGDVAGVKYNVIFISRSLNMLLEIVEKVTEQRFNALREFINLSK